MFMDEMKEMKKFQEFVSARLQSVLGLSAKVTLVEPKTIERFFRQG